MENEKEIITFGDKRYFKTKRFVIYFSLIVFSMVFSIYLIEQIIDPKGNFFIQIAIILTGFFVASFTFRVKEILML